jgi:hypothetical protein
MAKELQGQRIAFLATDGVEQVELKEPWKAVADAGGEPELLSIKEGEIQGFDHLDKADRFPVDRLVSDADVADYEAPSSQAGSPTRTSSGWMNQQSGSSRASSTKGSPSASSATVRGRSSRRTS